MFRAAPTLLLLLFAIPASLRAGAATTPEVEANSTAATATALASPGVGSGSIYPDGDVDYWKFTTAGPSRVYAAVVTSLNAGEGQFGDCRLTLYGTNGTTVLETDENDGELTPFSSSIAGASVPGAGTYYLRVDYGGVNPDVIRPYRLLLQTRSGSPTAETEPNDEPAQSMPASGWVSGTIDPGDVDAYALALAAGDTVFLSLDLDPERNGDFEGELAFGPFGGTVLIVDDGGTSTPDSEALAVTVLEAGTYSVEVDASSAGSGTYHLSATVLPQTDEGSACTTYTSTTVKAIPTGPGRTTSTIVVPGHPRIADLDVSIDLTHSNPGDLDVHLQSPAANDNGLFLDVGSADHPAIDVRLDDEAAFPIGVFTVAEGLVLAPEGFRLAWFDGEDGGGTWTLVIDDDLATNGGSLASWSLRICAAAPPPSCPGGSEPVTLLDESFESGDGGAFTHTGTQDEWELGTPSLAPITTCGGGTGCWKTDLNGTYNANADQSLYSPPIDLTAPGLTGPLVVRWSQRYQLEDSEYDTYSAVLQEVGGANATKLFEWLDGDMVYTVGSTQSQVEGTAGWSLVTRTLPSTYLGEAVELRFRVTSDATRQESGVAIDDVLVTACSTTSADLLFSDGFEAGTVCDWSSQVGAPSCP